MILSVQRKQAEALALQHLHKAATTPRSSDVDVNDMVRMEDVPIIDVTQSPVVSVVAPSVAVFDFSLTSDRISQPPVPRDPTPEPPVSMDDVLRPGEVEQILSELGISAVLGKRLLS